MNVKIRKIVENMHRHRTCAEWRQGACSHNQQATRSSAHEELWQKKTMTSAKVTRSHASNHIMHNIVLPQGSPRKRRYWTRGGAEIRHETVHGGTVDEINCCGVIFWAWEWWLVTLLEVFKNARPSIHLLCQHMTITRLGRFWIPWIISLLVEN